MRLSDLDAHFVRIGKDEGGGPTLVTVESLAEAQGVMLLCPGCFVTNGGAVGTHSVILWFVCVPPDIEPGPGRWRATGTCIDDLTFVEPAPYSVQIGPPCNWHGFIEHGEANTR